MNDSDTGMIDAVLRKLVKGGGIAMLGIFLELGISFIAKLIVGRYLSAANFGSITLALKILGFAAIFGGVGMKIGIQRYVPRFDDARIIRGIFVSGYQVLLVNSLLVALILFLLADSLSRQVFHDPAVGLIIRIVALAIPAKVFLDGLTSIRALEHVGPEIAVKSVLWPVSRFSLIVGVVLFGGGVAHIAGAYVASYWIAALAGIAVLARYTPLFDRSTDWISKHGDLIRFSAPLMVAGTMSFVLGSIDTLMIGSFLPLAAVGIYGVAYTLGSLLNLPLGALNSLFLPLFSEVESEGNQAAMQRIYISTTKWATFVALPMFMTIAIFTSEVIYYSFGQKYVAGATALQVIGLAYFVRTLMGPNHNGLQALGHSRSIMWTNVVVAGLNVVLNFVLIQAVGIVGAALATLLTFALLNVSYSAMLYLWVGLHPVSASIYRPVVAYSVVLLGLGGGLKLLLGPSLESIVVFVMVGGVVYPFVLALAGGINREDVMIVNSLEERFRVDLEPLKRYVRRLM